MPSEFNFISEHLAPLAAPEDLGLLDDAAQLTPPTGQDLVISQDTMVEGVHFPPREWGAGTAEKLLRVNLSDLAAKGAAPWGYFLSLSLPREMDGRWRAAFAAGLKQAQTEFDISLFGGDTTVISGPMVIGATVIGTVQSGEMIRRSGAKPGDHIYVSGTIGDAALGLDLALGKHVSPQLGEGIMAWEAAYQRPEPRLDLREFLQNHAHAALDVSDGLIADAQHLAKASGVRLILDAGSIPLSAPTRAWLQVQNNLETALLRLVTAGDDYQILFAGAPGLVHPDITFIGRVEAGQGVALINDHGNDISPARGGYLHF